MQALVTTIRVIIPMDVEFDPNCEGFLKLIEKTDDADRHGVRVVPSAGYRFEPVTVGCTTEIAAVALCPAGE